MHLCSNYGGSISLLYICILLELAVGVAVSRHLCSITWGSRSRVGAVVCKASMLDWWGFHLPSIYMHCNRSGSGCSGMQCIYAQLTGESICLLYICIVLYLTIGVVVCKASVLDWLGGLYLAVGVVVYKASLLNWLGGMSAFYINALY